MSFCIMFGCMSVHALDSAQTFLRETLTIVYVKKNVGPHTTRSGRSEYVSSISSHYPIAATHKNPIANTPLTASRCILGKRISQITGIGDSTTTKSVMTSDIMNPFEIGSAALHSFARSAENVHMIDILGPHWNTLANKKLMVHMPRITIKKTE